MDTAESKWMCTNILGYGARNPGVNRRLYMAKQGFIFLLIILAVLPQYLYAQSWTPGLKEAAKAVATGEATYAQKLQVHLHRAEVSKMGLTSTELQTVSAEAEKAFNLTNNRDIEAAADHVGFEAETKAPKKGFNPGADTDVNVVPKNPRQKITLKDIQAIEKHHDDLLRARCKKAGIPYKKPDIDTDYPPHPDHTTDHDFEEIAKYINEEKGGTAYRTRTAARAELKMASGEALNPNEVGVYAQEMKWQMNRKNALTSKLHKDLSQARKAQNLSAVQKLETEIQLANSQKSKYIQRTQNLNNQARKQYGLEPARQEIAGADAAIDTLNVAGRGALTAKEAAAVGTLSDSAMLKAQEELADTLIEAGKHFSSARQSLPHVLNDLPASSQGNMVARMEQSLGAEATKNIVGDAKILKTVTSAAAQDALNRFKSDLNFGRHCSSSGVGARLGLWRRRRQGIRQGAKCVGKGHAKSHSGKEGVQQGVGDAGEIWC